MTPQQQFIAYVIELALAANRPGTLINTPGMPPIEVTQEMLDALASLKPATPQPLSE